jgi:putative endonuclease
VCEACQGSQSRQAGTVEPYPTVEEAIAREKQLKAWKRLWKRRLISEANPDWEDLASRFNR